MYSQKFLTLTALVLASTTEALPATCHEIDPFQGDNLEHLLDTIKSQVCEKGCKPTTAQFDSWGRDTIVHPFILALSETMGLPNLPTVTKRLTDSISENLLNTCGVVVGDKDACQGQILDSFGQCMKKNLVSIVLEDADPYSFLVSDAMCEKAKKYVEGEDLWTKVIPGYLDVYASQCLEL
ncbi:hypothetical protein BDV25DRAFT_135952 [Aspergillus avenaceus]|uniref:Saposin B-type domain-containing protein n=1 Tax=Aspergillus avenaceus TaxID=36643 RepID=A0A5N6U6N7_ASPAV|nr:hypothetical protein BDV25DRAFT_135952 [Aspergillus avenaceus]